MAASNNAPHTQTAISYDCSANWFRVHAAILSAVWLTEELARTAAVGIGRDDTFGTPVTFDWLFASTLAHEIDLDEDFRGETDDAELRSQRSPAFARPMLLPQRA